MEANRSKQIYTNKLAHVFDCDPKRNKIYCRINIYHCRLRIFLTKKMKRKNEMKLEFKRKEEVQKMSYIGLPYIRCHQCV